MRSGYPGLVGAQIVVLIGFEASVWAGTEFEVLVPGRQAWFVG